ncbi:hypothetical protein RP20_CCG011423 [Aedes albopictus]|nr:hypothetical protein RP20_CCG011423 [Aedes albopictus]
MPERRYGWHHRSSTSRLPEDSVSHLLATGTEIPIGTVTPRHPGYPSGYLKVLSPACSLPERRFRLAPLLVDAPAAAGINECS